ncbi:MAG: long-chain-fatty-acid--CoA ligase, partial [Candidatus Nephrothrix sp. EaCA]
MEKPPLRPDDIAVLQYTGGTTGIAKGAQLTHGNLVAHTMMITEWFRPISDKTSKEIFITAIPLYHIFALTVNGIFAYHLGAKNVLIANPRDTPKFVKELGKHKFTIFTGVNTLFNGLLNQPDFHKLDFSPLKAVVAGGMALQDAV